jgi:N-carbamoyl-L-amino-acid hydrolase
MLARKGRADVTTVSRFVARLAIAAICVTSFAVIPACAQSVDGTKFHVNSGRLQGTLEKLSEFGRNPDGGVTRTAFSETDMAAREYVMGLMKEAGLEVHVDPAGNIFGLRAGTEKLPILLTGSHIDSVLHGGNYDGDVGSMGAIEVIRALNDGSVKTRHPIEVVIWANEEGNHFGIGTMGSGIAAGIIGPEILYRKDDQGLTVADWLRKYDQDPAHLTDARIPRGALSAFIELHIEQGPHLDEAKIPIGIVQGIVGVKRWKCVATGFANHAGTTPMDRRKDALAAASKDVLSVREVVRAESGHQVGTVGFMRVEPGAINVIPGRAEFPVELRDLDAAKVDRMWQHIREKFRQTDKEERTETSCTPLDESQPAPTDATMQAMIREAAKSLNLATMDLPSEAGQDSQEIAKIAPMAMIFVPSKDGISHSPKEFTSWQDVANGAEILYRTLLLLDSRLDQKDPVIKIGGNLMAAKIVHKVSPVYPANAIADHIAGTVRIQVIIEKDGTIHKLQVVSGPAVLQRAALDAVRQWQYQPTLLNGEPVAVQTIIEVTFFTRAN